jgi:hypothetical protein
MRKVDDELAFLAAHQEVGVHYMQIWGNRPQLWLATQTVSSQ